jgi:hypothetical protein
MAWLQIASTRYGFCLKTPQVIIYLIRNLTLFESIVFLMHDEVQIYKNQHSCHEENPYALPLIPAGIA